MSGSGSPLLGSPSTVRHRSRSPMSVLGVTDLENGRYAPAVENIAAQRSRRRLSCRFFPFSLPAIITPPGLSGDGEPEREKPRRNRYCSSYFRGSRCVLCQSPRKARWMIFLGIILIFGSMHFLSFALGALSSPWNIDWVAQHFENGQSPTELFPHWPTNYTGDVKPVPCHSHNDYWRDVSLFSALQAGCIGVEADVWLFGDELYVGHSPSSLALHRTLKAMYVQPLLEILDNRNPQIRQPGERAVLNGVFDTVPSQTLVLLVDIKARGRKSWPVLQAQLAPLRERGYLTHFNGTHVVERPITVVGTGRTPYELLVANSTYRDIFFDAPLDRLGSLSIQAIGSAMDGDPDYDIEEYMHAYLSEQSSEDGESSRDGTPDTVQHGAIEKIIPYDSTNSYYASASFKKAVGFPLGFRLSNKQRGLIREQVREANERGLKARYWSTPGWPRFLRNYIWRVLIEEGADILNIDDLRSPIKMGIIGVRP